MAQSSVAPHDPAAARGSSRRTQSEIYRAGISGTRPSVPVDADALEAAARKTLGAEAFAYIAGGAGAERTVAANRRAFERWQVWPRPLRDVAERDLSIELLGRRRPTPFVLAPLGVMELAHRDADIAVAKGAASIGVPYTLSNQASFAMEDVAAAAPAGVRLFQLYWSANDELNGSLLRRAEASGCEAIVVTLDTHLLGWRTRDLDLAYLPFTRGLGIAQYTSDPVFQQLVRERVRTAGDPSTGSGTGVAGSVDPSTGSGTGVAGSVDPATGSGTGVAGSVDPSTGSGTGVRMTAKTVAAGIQIARKGSALTGGGLRDSLRSPLPRAAVETFLDVFSTPALTWTDLAKAREWTTLPIILKGILHPDDATRAMDAGVDGVWVSNHGGRQIDQSVPALAALPGVVDRVRGAVPVIFDSGVRGGADAFIALALGATAVAIGRPYAYGLAIAGEAGVREVLRNHIAELDITLGLSGFTSIRDVGAEALREA
ncbi:alpha-hydroxy-acid oxidizing protein [Micromonospora sp. DT81.3]|uniref:alpha-hydroxy-acid oxidizing protein n=1 Tax=Micromonospora sp. DT81.3 TaxID=3416523 RepID=UPI003CE871E0